MKAYQDTPFGVLFRSWPLRPLPEVVFFQEGPGLRKWQWTETGMKVINVTNILADGSVDVTNTTRFISSDEFKIKYQHFTVEAGDIVVASSGNTYGKVGRIDRSHLPIMMNTSVIRFHPKNPRDLHPDFLYAFLRSHLFKNQMESFVIGSAQPNFGPSHLKRMVIPCPDISTQRKIASIHSAYDDLIENNNRRIAILESMAQTLYQEWFVRFRFPGYENVPLVDETPVGWRRTTLTNCASFLSGGTPSKSRADYWQGQIPWISSGELTAMRVRDSSLHISEKGAEAGSRIVPPDTTLVVVRGMSLAKEFRMGMVSREVAFNQDLKALVARPGVDPYLLFHNLREQRDQIRDRATEATHGTKKLDTRVLEDVSIIVPDEGRQRSFREQVEPLHRLWDTLSRQIDVLRRTRALLLPKLISGQIDVKHLDIDTGEPLASSGGTLL